MTWTGSNLNDIKICRISDLILICLAYLCNKCINRLIFHNTHCTSAKSCSGHTRTDDTIYFPSLFHKRI